MTINLTLSHSQVQAYNKCKFYWKLKYIDGWVTFSTGDMNRGTWIHEALNYGYSVNNNREMVRDYLGQKIRDASSETMPEIARYTRIVQRYFEEFVPASDQEQITIGLEKEFELELLSATGRPFKLRGFIDRIFSYRGRIFVEDFKTMNRASWWDQISLMLDPQMTIYSAVLPYIPELGIPSVDGVAVTQLNCYDYKNNAFETKPISDIVRREKVYRTDMEKANILVELGNVADEILSQLENNKPFTKSLTRNCNKCDFSEACQFSLRGVNIEPFLAAKYTRKDNPLSLQLLEMKADAD